VTGTPVAQDLDDRIKAALGGGFPYHILDAQPPLAIKYVSAKRAVNYHQPGQSLSISSTVGFTWGRATYVAPLSCPLSTAIYGRAGVISRFDPSGWRTFDATVKENEDLYIRWLQAQILYRKFLVTAQSAYISQLLRNQFRRKYHIDCVLFRPDQANPRYTNVKNDIWMAVTDWIGPDIAMKESQEFREPRLTVLIEEEFEFYMGGIHCKGLLNLATARPPGNLSDTFRQAYYAGEIVRIPS
jgi:hypothetical protein